MKTKMFVAVAVMAGSLFLTGGPVSAQGYYIPKPGSAERKAIMNALRGPVQKDLKIPVIFTVRDDGMFRVVGDWAFISAQFLNPDGSPMRKGYFSTGMRSDTTQALLHKVNGKWRVVTHVTAATDVEWQDWAKKYHAPAKVVPSVG